MDDILDQIRAGVTREMETALEADINPLLMHAVTQSYLLLKILDMLDNINTKMVMMNINIQDVEQAVLAQQDKQNNE